MHPSLPVSRYHVPLFVYSPAHVQPRRIERMVGQIDVAPTLPGLLHWNCDSRSFGKDIPRMGDADERALLSNYQHLSLLDRQRLVVLSPGNEASVLEPADANTARPLAADSRLLDPALALYQGAARLYRRHLGLWLGAPSNPAPLLAGARGMRCPHYPRSRQQGIPTHGFERCQPTFSCGPTTPQPPATRWTARRRGADPGAGGQCVLRRPLAAARA